MFLTKPYIAFRNNGGDHQAFVRANNLTAQQEAELLKDYRRAGGKEDRRGKNGEREKTTLSSQNSSALAIR